MRIAGPIAILLVLGIPLADADEMEDFTIQASLNDTLRVLAIDTTIHLRGDEAKGTRALLDSGPGGNGDGTVTQAEVDSFEQFVKDTQQGGAKPREVLDSGNMTMDGRGPTGATFVLELEGGPGLVSSADPVSMKTVASLTFTPGPGPTHTFAIRGPAMDTGSGHGTFSLQAPAGHTMSVTGLAGHTLSADKRTVSLHSDAGSLVGTIVFTPVAATASSPVPVLPLVAVVVLAMAGAVRALPGRRE